MNIYSNRYEVLTDNGFQDFNGIKKTIKNYYLKLIFDDNSYIECTYNHLLKTKDGVFKEAKKIKVKEKLFNNLSIKKIIKKQGRKTFYDLIDVNNGHEYITNNVISHNCAFIDKNIWDAFYASVYPTITSGKKTKVVMVSTPNGMNHFHKLWMDAVNKKNKYVPIKVTWDRVPGRDEKFKEETLSNIGPVRWEQEFGLSFLGSSYTLISGSTLESLAGGIELYNTRLHQLLDKGLSPYLKIYNDARPDRIYTIGVDSAKTTEMIVGDKICIQVLDITEMPYKQVAVLQTKGLITYHMLPEIVVAIATYYNEAHMFIENNEIGQSIADSIYQDFEYENIYFEKDIPGFRTTTKTKRVGCADLKLLIENNNLIINDEETISQLSTFVKHKGSYAAEQGSSDDSVMALLAAIHFQQSTYVELNDYGDRKKRIEEMLKHKKIEAEEMIDEYVMSFGFTSDSIDNDIESVF